MKKTLAIIISKIIAFIGGIFGRGSSLPGYIALKIDKDICKKINTENTTKIAITGANGKSTTTTLLYEILKKNGYNVSANLNGSNMRPGVLTSILKATDLKGNLRSDVMIMEVDEFSSVKIYDSFKPDYLIVTNILRDHIERQSDIINVINKINEKLDENTTLILNSDDPLVQLIMKGKHNKRYYYGINDLSIAKKIDNCSLAGKFCLNCLSKLEYTVYFYEHLGHYKCPNCDFERPIPHIYATTIDYKNNNMIINNEWNISVGYEAIYMYYNYLAVVTASTIFDLPISKTQEVAKGFYLGNARLEKFYLRKREGVMNFLKNATSFSVTLDLILQDKNDKTLVFVMDNTYDGRYFITQWYWDTSLEKLLSDKTIKKIVCTWKRSYDMAVRLKTAGIDSNIIKVEPDIKKALDYVRDNTVGKVYLGYDTDSHNIKNIKKILSAYPENHFLK